MPLLPTEIHGEKLLGINRRWRFYRYLSGNLPLVSSVEWRKLVVKPSVPDFGFREDLRESLGSHSCCGDEKRVSRKSSLKPISLRGVSQIEVFFGSTVDRSLFCVWRV